MRPRSYIGTCPRCLILAATGERNYDVTRYVVQILQATSLHRHYVHHPNISAVIDSGAATLGRASIAYATGTVAGDDDNND
jgi:hypothetical protein